MNSMLSLIIAGLLAIHQYIPIENKEYIKYFNDVRDVTIEDVFPAAHQSCLYLSSVFISVGLEKTFGSLANQTFGQTLIQELGKEEMLDSMLNTLLTEPYSTKLKKYNLDPQETVNFLSKLCKNDFSPFDFKYQQKKLVLDFIKSEIHVLSPKDFEGLGQMGYFGTVPIKDRKQNNIGSFNTGPRKWVSYNEISNHLILSILSAEDQNFFDHKGVDTVAISRMAKQLLGGTDITGGSTITMQLLKNMYLNHLSSNTEMLNNGTGKKILRKVREWYWALPFEKHFANTEVSLLGKKKILEYYFNLLNFGPRIEGVGQAAHTYFSKEVQDLSLAEAAYIVSLLKAPYRYSNHSNYEKYTQGRRDDYVLERVINICSQILNSQFKTKKPEVKKILKNLCKQGSEKINLEYVNREKQLQLPLWTASKRPSESVAIQPIRKQVKKYIEQISGSTKQVLKEFEVQTTIDKNLQDIVFDTVIDYLDDFDTEQALLSRVKPARDDTGKQAQILSTDVHWRLNYQIQNLLELLTDTDTQFFYSIRLRLQDKFSSNSLNFELAKEFLTQQGRLSSSQIDQYIRAIQNELLQMSQQEGEILFIELKPDLFSVLSLSEFMNRVSSKLSLEKINEIKIKLSTNQLRNHIYKNSLARMYKYRSRDYLEPVLYLGKNDLINKDLQKITLSNKSLSHLNSSYSFKTGDFFWVSLDQSTSNTVYNLQPEKLEAAVVIMDSHTGELLASFDGYDPDTYFYRSNQSKRQIGSLIKPWIYLYSLDKQNFLLQSTLDNTSVAIPIENGKLYRPTNISNRYTGPLAFFKGLIHSQNVATVSLIQNPLWNQNTSLYDMMFFLQDVGLYKDYQASKVYPSILLGAEEETLSQMVSSFSFFANGKYTVKPYLIDSLIDYKGDTFFKQKSQHHSPHLQKYYSTFQMQSLLLQIANTGTAARLNNFTYNLNQGQYRETCYNGLLKANQQSCFGGKTGTSDNGENLWFVGFSKNFVIGIWVGYNNPESTNSTSSKVLPLFEDLVQKGIDYLPPIEPVIGPLDQPFALEKREVYGNQACSNALEEETSQFIYTLDGSQENKCFNPNIQVDEKCTCYRAQEISRDSDGKIISRVEGYGLDIFYKNTLFEKIAFFHTFQECEKKKKRFINEKTGEKVCM